MSELGKSISSGSKAARRLIRGSERYMRSIKAINKVDRGYKDYRRKASELDMDKEEDRKERKILLKEAHRTGAATLTYLCRKNGATWVKLAQFLSCRPDILPREYIEELRELQNEAPEISFSKLEKNLVREWGEDWREKFTDFDEDPVATASVAQVHRATLANGDDVAVKIMLPGVRELFAQDTLAFHMLARILGPWIKGVNVKQIVSQLLDMTRKELDFTNEIENLKLFSEQDHPSRIVVPPFYEELSSKRVMVTGWIEGNRLREYLDVHTDEAKDLLGVLLDSYMKQILQFGVYHADPHPGNFIVTPDQKIAILDYGALDSITNEEKMHYSALLMCLLGYTDGNITQLFENAGFTSNDKEALPRLAEYIINWKKAGKGKNTAESFNEIMTKLQESKIDIPDSFVGLGRVLMTVNGFMLAYKVKFQWLPGASDQA